MARKIAFFGTSLSIIILGINYHFFIQKEPVKAQKEITIFTLNTLAGIHAKMITGNSGIIEIASEKITHQERASMKQSDIVIDTVALDKSPLNKELQSYQGLYITIPGTPKEDIFYEVSAIQKQIETIRDALSERNPKQRGYYYDNAGNYIQLLRDTQDTLNSRIRKYRPLPFITIGGNFDTFIQIFGLSESHIKHYKDLKDFLGDTSNKEFIRTKKINHVFIYKPLSDQETRSIEKSYSIALHRLPQINEDTSSWGYLGYLEKVTEKFILAFDTYD